MPVSNDVIEKIEEQIRQNWRSALACPGARRIFGRMVHTAAFSQSHYFGDSLATAFNEGARSVGLSIMQQIELAKPGETAVLLAENLQEMNHVDQTD